VNLFNLINRAHRGDGLRQRLHLWVGPGVSPQERLLRLWPGVVIVLAHCSCRKSRAGWRRYDDPVLRDVHGPDGGRAPAFIGWWMFSSRLPVCANGAWCSAHSVASR